MTASFVSDPSGGNTKKEAMKSPYHQQRKCATSVGDSMFWVPNRTFFFSVGNQTFVRDVTTQRNFLFDGSALEILDELRTPHRISDLAERIAERFGIEAAPELLSDIIPFVEQLLREHLLESDSIPQSSMIDANGGCSVEDKVRSECMKAHHLWSACLELTHRCNERCVHCYLDEPEKAHTGDELKLPDWKRIVDECRDLGCAKVLVTGGEPTLHPDFVELCQYIVGKGLLLDIYTNGLHVTDAVFEAISALPVNSVSVSLYGLADFHDSVTQVPGSFEKTLSTAMKFKCAGKDVYIKAVVFRDHLDDFKALHHLGRRLGMTVTPASVLVPGRSGASKEGILLTEEEYESLLAFQSETAVTQSSRAGTPDGGMVPGRDLEGPVCGAGQAQLSFSPTGIAFPCTALPIPVGDARWQNVREIWEKSPELKDIQRFRFRDLSPRCSSCPHSGSCTICLGSAWPKNALRTEPPTWACRQAAMRAEMPRQPFSVRACEH